MCVEDQGVFRRPIIVRSVKVAWDNIMSNFLHLSLRGIDPITMFKKTREKFIEITQFVKNQEQIKKLDIELAAVIDSNPARARRLMAQIDALKDANGRMSIAPLIEAGEFSTISEDLSEADVAFREGKFMDFIEKATDKLPGWAGTGAKNLLITKDTALFQGLNRMVQYGDFVAKAVLYDHLTEKKEMGKEEALDEILEEFVQYNRLPGRGRDLMESMGLLWFYNYKLRITKVALKMARERPIHSLLMSGGVGPVTYIQSVFGGSLPGAFREVLGGKNRLLTS